VKKTVAVNLLIDDRTALVVGGGQVGRRKTKLLLDSGVAVELVAPDALDELVRLADEGKIVWHRRPFENSDAAGHLVAFACSDDKHVNRSVLDAARRAHVPCCCCDMNWPDGDFTTPATVRSGDFTVAVSTSGQDCRRARDFKNEIMEMLEERKDLTLVAIGTSDALLPSRKRAPFHLQAPERAALGRLVKRVRGVREFFILNTCNRVELIAVCSPEPEVADVLLRLAGFDRLAPTERFRYVGFEAFRHLVRVASGLESSLLGEFHVVSQFKDALDEAEANGWSGGALRFTGAEILRVSKSVRHEVEGLMHVAEIDHVAVRYLSVHGGLGADSTVLVVGTGMVGRGAAEALVKQGVNVIWAYHVHKPADDLGVGKVVQMDDLPAALAEADIVISAVGASSSVITPAMASAVADRNVLMIDLGVPRNVDPFFDDCGHGVTVADLDDLKLWHRVKSGTLKEVLERADAVIQLEYRAIVG